MKYKAYALMAILLASATAVSAIGTAYAQTGLTVKTDKTDYAAQDTITISGKVGTVVAGQPVLIKVTNPNNAIYRFDQIPATGIAADGSYTYDLKVGGKLGVTGKYTVEATYGGVTQTTTFNFTSGGGGGTPGFKKIDMVVTAADGRESKYQVEYQINGGTLEELTGDQATKTITATITADADGQLILRIPTNVANADKSFQVFVDADDVSADVKDDNGKTVRQLTIPFVEGSETVDIVGTFMVPEFGAIAAIVLAVAIVGIIVATTRYSGKFNFGPKI
jgi:predicted secreted protein with PEFG-CTERM motif